MTAKDARELAARREWTFTKDEGGATLVLHAGLPIGAGRNVPRAVENALSRVERQDDDA